MEIKVIPNFILNIFSLHGDKKNHVNILLSSIVFFLFITFIQHFTNLLTNLPHVCLFQKILGIPCPGCGIVRSFIAIISLDLISAWRYNPVGIFIVLFILIQIPVRLFAILEENIGKKIDNYSRFISNLICIILVSVWMLKVNLQFLVRR